MEPYSANSSTGNSAPVTGGAVKKVARLTKKLKAKMMALVNKARKVGGDAEEVAKKADKIQTDAAEVAEEMPTTETEVKEEIGSTPEPAAEGSGRRRRKSSRKTRRASRKSKHRRSLFGLKY